MTHETKNMIDEYYAGNISSQKLISFISRFESASNEEIYKTYHNISNMCNHCNSEMSYSGFKFGFRCTQECGYSRKLKPIKELEPLSKELILENITKQEYVSKKFLNNYNITPKECYNIVYSLIIKSCKYCENEAKFESWKHGYDEICSDIKCKRAHRKYKTEHTNLEKYGVKNISQLKEIKDRKQESYTKTCLDKYGADNVFKVKDIMYKDGIHVAQTADVREKRKNTLLELYGTNDTFSINDGRLKAYYKCHIDENVKKKELIRV